MANSSSGSLYSQIRSRFVEQAATKKASTKTCRGAFEQAPDKLETVHNVISTGAVVPHQSAPAPQVDLLQQGMQLRLPFCCRASHAGDAGDQGYRYTPAADCLGEAATYLSCSLRAASVALVPTRTNFSTQSTFSAANMTVTAVHTFQYCKACQMYRCWHHVNLSAAVDGCMQVPTPSHAALVLSPHHRLGVHACFFHSSAGYGVKDSCLTSAVAVLIKSAAASSQDGGTSCTHLPYR